MKVYTVGNIAKLRDALVKARRFIDSSPLMSIRDNTGTIARGELCAEIDAALAAPVKNCEVGTAEERNNRHDRYCVSQRASQPMCEGTCASCFARWLQMPYEEGGVK